MKKFLLNLTVIALASLAQAQPLPEFPALGGDLASTSGLPDMPPVNSQPIAGSPASLPDLPAPSGDPALLTGLPALSSGTAPAGLPDLPPVDGAPVMTAAANGLPDLPAVESAPAAPSSGKALPPLPAQPASQPAVVPATGLPPLPEAKPVAPAPAVQPVTEVEPAAATNPSAAEPVASTASANAKKPAVKKAVRKKPVSPWAHPPKPHPNTMFGGYVTPKGKGEEMHLAWSSQEILNAMLGNKYELLKEEGEYNPGGWREFTFQHIRTKRQVQVYVKSTGARKVWMRVGPGEPPAGVPYQESVNVRKEAETALKILRKQFGKNLTPRGRSWEAPFDRPRS